MTGLIHIYTGMGKGKTTAAIGLGIRFAGNGGSVFFSQFLKDDRSGELNLIKKIPEFFFFPSEKYFGFTKQMTPEVRSEAKKHYDRYFEKVVQAASGAAKEPRPCLVIFDEIVNADGAGLVSHDRLLRFLREKPEPLEVVLTGRNPSDDLIEIADYVSEIQKKKHPYDRGVKARKGVEM